MLTVEAVVIAGPRPRYGTLCLSISGSSFCLYGVPSQ